MKSYLAEKVFADPDFPLAVNYAPQASLMPWHCHDFTELVLVEQGHSIHSSLSGSGEELTYGIIQGDAFAILPGEIHRYFENKNFVVYNIAFREEIIAPELAELTKLESWDALLNPKPAAARNKIHLMLTEYLSAKRCLERIIAEFSSQKCGFRLNARIAFLEFLVIVARERAVEWSASADAKSSKILESITAMGKFFQQPFSLREHAALACMSVSSYTKKFRAATGVSPLDYFTGIRMEKARYLLANSDMSIAEIAYKCGFNDPNYLIKVFRIRQGTTPAKYRALFRRKEKTEG